MEQQKQIDTDREQLGYWITVREEASRTLLHANKKIEEITDYILKKEAYYQSELPYQSDHEFTD